MKKLNEKSESPIQKKVREQKEVKKMQADYRMMMGARRNYNI